MEQTNFISRAILIQIRYEFAICKPKRCAVDRCVELYSLPVYSPACQRSPRVRGNTSGMEAKIDTNWDGWCQPLSTSTGTAMNRNKDQPIPDAGV